MGDTQPQAPGSAPFLPKGATPLVLPPRPRAWLRWTLGLAALAVSVSALAAAILWRSLAAPGPLTVSVTVEIPRGASVREIARTLEEAGVVENAEEFELAARLAGDALKAGEYRIPAHASVREAIRILQSDRTVAYALTVPEGLTTAQVLAQVATADALAGELPQQTAEGELLPETYHYKRGDRRADVIERMRQAMRETLALMWENRAEGLPLNSPRDALILASIVEKETGKEDERARVAAVFVNRLRLGMRLQSDPTVVYGLTNGSGPLGRSLVREDLTTPSPYNTYQIAGLPPGPIANPSRASIAAVLLPASSKELYFVADGNGGHLFAETLAQHERNVARYRTLQQQRR